ncbi:MAG: ABC transporter substrate-binding protein [SAR324 cluster bacterium]|nr:ABC transporter substrate-binding protein [SAR324 cluster bacterium]
MMTRINERLVPARSATRRRLAKPFGLPFGLTIGLALAAAAVAGFGLSADHAQAQQKSEIKIGIVSFLSGPAAGPFGIPARDGSQLVIDGINGGTIPSPYDSKGILGAKIVPVFIDEAGGSAKQVGEFRNLVQRQNVDVVIGYISSGDCLAIAPVAEELKALTIFGDCGTPRIFEQGSYKYVFRTRSHAAMDNISAALYLKEMMPNIGRYGGINQNYAWGQDSWRDFSAAMSVLHPSAEVTTKQFPKIFAGQYSSEISALLLSRSDVVHSSLWGADLESFIFQATARGLNRRTQLVFTSAEPNMFRLGDKMPDGVLIGARGPYGVYAHDTPLNRWFRAEYIRRHDTPPVYASYVLGQAFLALKISVEKAAAANEGNWPTTEQIIAAMEYLEFEAFGSRVKLALGKGHQAITETAVGRYKYDEAAGGATIVDIKYYPAECVNPPEGAETVEWIRGGMKGARCN